MRVMRLPDFMGQAEVGVGVGVGLGLGLLGARRLQRQVGPEIGRGGVRSAGSC